MSAGLSIREFARREGCNDKLVRRAIQSGRLIALEDGSLSPDLVGTGWKKSNRRGAASADMAVADSADMSAEPPTGATLEQLLEGGGTLAEAELAKARALAAKHVITARRAAGEVVERELAEKILLEEARRYRDAWQTWPSKVAPLIAADLGVSGDAVLEVLSRHVHDQLVELGEPEPDLDRREP